ncbi:MAG: M20/M25/M40 family metallo-hydrolase, partial [Phycisphaerae bacterium]|nr:M20/M25/M40 family metallo-hydrolase [Phycisphaerae bacterium]
SGEEAFWNGTQFDSIMSRYSYSTEIYKAETYIDNYLQQLGYPTELQPFSVATFYDIQFVNGHSDDGWLTTEGKIFGTSDGGQTWQVQFGNSSAGIIWSVFPIDQQTAVAVGDNGLILKTTNGATWQIQSSSTSSFLFGVYFRSQTQGWIAGDNGVILKTTDGGATWNTKNTPASSRLYDIFFTNDNLGWAVGRDGTILHTRDGGETWALQSSGTGSRLYGVHFLDENTGFAVGWGIALKTTNGGSSWSQLSVPTGVYYYDVDFIDTNNGMIVGWDGTCLSTTDGGNTWTTGGNIFDKDLYAFDMVNTTAVWASGNTIVAHSDDTGMSWQSGLSNIPETTLNNVIATKTGTQYPDEYYIICGHYDDTSEDPMNYAPGADDNASGTVGVMEAARVLSEYNFHYSIKFILFAGEEQGLWGSAAYASNAASNGEQILGVLNMDMIGYDGNMDGSMEIHEGTMSASQTLGNFVAANINNWGLPIAPQIKTYNSSSASDHSSFWNYGYPAILVIE